MSGHWETVVGLEIHAELSTKSKIFCGCENRFGAPPNTLCCPVCMGLPGALPALNRQVVDYAILMGHALACRISSPTHMDRKHYFYPDLPKAYQISQFDVPLCRDGHLEFTVEGEKRRIDIERIHMEEDAGKLLHEGDGETLADYNRCGVPLIEIVTKPDLRGADETKAAMRAVALVLAYLGISDVKMQEGSLRADVNVSVRRAGKPGYGARCEMKNVNSFGAVYRAVQYEAARQIQILEQGGVIEPQTRRWDDGQGRSFVMRSKEEAPDYRFFPDPDLPPFAISDRHIQALKEGLPELPLARIDRYQGEWNLSPYDAEQLCADKYRADFFETAVACEKAAPKLIANWLLGDVAGFLAAKESTLSGSRLTPQNLAALVQMVDTGVVTGTAAKQLLSVLLERDAPPEVLAQELGLLQERDEQWLIQLVQGVLAQNGKAVGDYQNGKTSAMGYLVGQGMKQSRGRANPEALKSLLEKALGQI